MKNKNFFSFIIIFIFTCFFYSEKTNAHLSWLCCSQQEKEQEKEQEQEQEQEQEHTPTIMFLDDLYENLENFIPDHSFNMSVEVVDFNLVITLQFTPFHNLEASIVFENLGYGDYEFTINIDSTTSQYFNLFLLDLKKIILKSIRKSIWKRWRLDVDA